MSNKKLPEGRCVAYIPSDAFVERYGFRVSMVFERGDGHYPTGDWPYEGKPGQQRPWFWGMTLDSARAEADDYNQKLGISPTEAAIIVARSMARSTPRQS